MDIGTPGAGSVGGTLLWSWDWQYWGLQGGHGNPSEVSERHATPCPWPPGPSTGHGQAPQGTGGQEEEEEKDEASEEKKEEEAGMTVVTRHKRHPSLGEGQAIASVIIYRTLAGLLPQHFDTDKRSLRCQWGWGLGGLGVAHGVSGQS